MTKKPSQKGFTIIETLVAITILMISIAGPLTITHKGLLAAANASDNVTASYLAQDAVEYIKNIRDNNMLNNEIWLTSFGFCAEYGECKVDTINGNVSACDVYSDDCKLRYSAATGYTHSPLVTTKSKYTRYIYLVARDGDAGMMNQALLVVKVLWNSTGNVKNEVKYETEIFRIQR